jgi:hypothetical protein
VLPDCVSEVSVKIFILCLVKSSGLCFLSNFLRISLSESFFRIAVIKFLCRLYFICLGMFTVWIYDMIYLTAIG